MTPEGEDMLNRILLSIILAGSVFAQAAPTDIRWADSFKDVRAGRVKAADGTDVIWVYWFGIDQSDGKVYIRKRVIFPGGVTAQLEARAMEYIRGNDPTLPSAPASEELWNDPRAKPARDALEMAFATEVLNGTVPKPIAQATHRVAPNPFSTSTPKTRPMFEQTGVRQIADRAVVGAPCDCQALKVTKGAETLCPLQPATMPVTKITACVKDGPP